MGVLPQWQIMRIPQSFIDDLLARADIVELVDARVPLRKMGVNYGALCPFHTEKSPSFTVSQTKQFYYCFGCGAHGNALGFLMQYDKLEFLDAIETLAAKVGLEIPKEIGFEQTPAQTDLYALLMQATRFYQKQLKQNQAAIHYLKSRGLSGEIAKRFGIGYAPEGWDHLLRSFPADNKVKEQLFTAGMILKKEGFYDRFRARIMFPIRDLRGRVIAFGGRTLGDELPKYLNSPETPIFHKGSELYGLYEARQANNKLEKIIIVEGYMDVIALAQHGISNAVATLGTATSSKHLQRLLRYTSDIIFCFDGDNAGKQAAWRALEIALPIMRDGIRINFMFLPQTEDPDSFVRKNGKEFFLQAMQQAISLADFFFQHLQEQTDLKTAEGKAKLVNLATQLLNKLPHGIFQQLMFEKLAELIGMDSNKLQSALTTETKEVLPEKKRTASMNTKMKSPAKLAILLLLQYPILAQEIAAFEFLNTFADKETIILLRLLEILKQQPHLTTGALLGHWQEPKEAAILAKLAAYEHPLPAADCKAEFLGAMERLSLASREQTIQTLLNKAKQQELSSEEKKQLQELLAKHKQVI